MSTTLIRNALLVDWLPLSVEPADLLIENGDIVARGTDLSAKGVDEVDVNGRLVMPGWVIAHHHLYSALAKGMPMPPHQPTNFLETLRWVWWVLDRSLDDASTRYSALVGGLDAIACGATFIVDHHAAPNAIKGSLNIIGQSLESLGVRSVLAYEVSDRDGPDIRAAGLAENFSYEGIDGWSWRFPGGHASFTMSDAALAGYDKDQRIHVHLLEDVGDRTLSEANFDGSPVARFDKYGLVTPGSLFAHGVHLTDLEFELLQKRGAWLVCNPRSNANNRVGIRGLDKYAPIGCLGTDGMDSNLYTELKFAYFHGCHDQANDPMGALLSMLQNNYKLARQLSGLNVGSLQPGCPADLQVVDYPGATPVNDSNFLGHLVYGIHAGHVRDVMSGGEWRYRNGLHLADEATINKAANTQALGLWKRMDALWQREGGHPYLK